MSYHCRTTRCGCRTGARLLSSPPEYLPLPAVWGIRARCRCLGRPGRDAAVLGIHQWELGHHCCTDPCKGCRHTDIKISIPCARSEDEPANAFRSTTRLYEACQIGRDGDGIELVHLGVNIRKVCLEICNTLLGSLEILQPLNPADLLAISMFETSFRKHRSEQPEAYGRMHDIDIAGSLPCLENIMLVVEDDQVSLAEAYLDRKIHLSIGGRGQPCCTKQSSLLVRILSVA